MIGLPNQFSRSIIFDYYKLENDLIKNTNYYFQIISYMVNIIRINTRETPVLIHCVISNYSQIYLNEIHCIIGQRQYILSWLILVNQYIIDRNIYHEIKKLSYVQTSSVVFFSGLIRWRRHNSIEQAQRSNRGPLTCPSNLCLFPLYKLLFASLDRLCNLLRLSVRSMQVH